MDRRIIEYLPHVLRDVREVLGWTDGQQWAFDRLWISADRVFANQFILDADDYGLSRWEKLLKIIPKAEDTLDIRRERILLRLRDILPFTLRRLRQTLELLCGEGNASADIEKASYLLTVVIDLSAQPFVDDVMELLARMVPANLLFKLYVLFTADPVSAYETLLPLLHGVQSETRLGALELETAYLRELAFVGDSRERSMPSTILPQVDISPYFQERAVISGGSPFCCGYTVTALPQRERDAVFDTKISAVGGAGSITERKG